MPSQGLQRVFIFLLAGAAVCAACPPAGARAAAGNPTILAVNRSLSVSYRLSHIYYIEPSDNPAFPPGSDYLDYEKGSTVGSTVGFSWMSAQSLWYLHGEWGSSDGRLDYTGYYQLSYAPAAGQSGADIQDYALKLGKGFAAGDDWMLTPYGSFGGRDWRRELGVGTAGDYVETYRHSYLAVGSLIQYARLGQFVITGDAEIGRTLSPTIDIPLFGLSKVALGVAPILNLALDIDRPLTNTVHLFAGGNFSYFGYGQSGIQNIGGGLSLIEPISHTETYDYSFGLRYSY